MDKPDKVSTRAAELFAQEHKTAVAQVTAVQLKPMDKGLEVILETASEFPEVLTSSAENSLITDIPNAQLRLPGGREFWQDNPTEAIATVTVTNLDAKTIRVTVTGKAGVPTAEVSQSPQALILSVVAPPAPTTPPAVPAPEPPPAPQQPAVPEAPAPAPQAEEKPVEFDVVAEEESGGYSVPDATTATRTDTPLRDIPQSIQVVPRQVLEDQQIIRVTDALRNVSGVQRGNTIGNTSEVFTIRGFQQFGADLRDSFRESTDSAVIETANLERIEVLKGPASVLYGNLDPGGVINFITEQPLLEPIYSAELQAGSFGLVRPTLDLTGPLNLERTVLYRLNTAYERGGYFRDFDQEVERFFVSPVLSFQIGDRTDLTLELEYLDDERPFDRGLVAIGRGVADIPYNRILGELDDNARFTQLATGYRLEHEFNDDWRLRNRFRFFSSDRELRQTQPDTLNEQTGELSRTFYSTDTENEVYSLQTDLIGKFTTGPIQHTLVFGADLYWQTRDTDGRSIAASSINIFDPTYGTLSPPDRDQLPTFFLNRTQTNSLGIYLQDQVTLTENLKLLIGGRFDTVDQGSLDRLTGTETEQQDEAFTPRVGIVYQPIQPISLYTSYSQSLPNSGTQADGSLLEPQRGTQYEVGIRGEFLDTRLITNLAAYDLTRSNIPATDPNNPDFVIPIGEQRSQGIELDVAGEILPGWNVIASYAYTNARITEGDDEQEGNLLNSVPFNAASLWTTYELQSGSLQGLGFGLGLFYVGEREGDLDNSFVLPSYLRTDASIFYRRDNWRVALNFNNLFNVDYIETSQSRITITPGSPFAIVGRVSVEF